MKIGLYGGTFNPPHNSHVKIAKCAKQQLELDKLIVMPCGEPPHKVCDVDAKTRYQLSQLAFGNFATVSDYELLQHGASYTIFTVQMLREKYPDSTIYLIVGADSLRDVALWYNAEQLVKLVTFAVAGRKGVAVGDGESFVTSHGGNVVWLDIKQSAISSSEIRLRYDFDLDADNFVPSDVDLFIRQHNLYRPHGALADKLRTYLKPARYSHTFYVTKRGLQLANGRETEKVFLACALHDCAKYIAPNSYKKYGFVCESDVPLPVIHAFLGAKVAQQDFGIDDGEVLDSIYYHTTARPDMTWLDKIVYVADKTEESRKYKVEHLLELPTLDDIFVATLLEAMTYGQKAHPDFYGLSEQARIFYTTKNNGDKH